ncbi:DUF4388 domain-containing protein [Geothrix fermentans]|jgi:hypothetical protein|uniref:DUF4388 domain-containing protein n=1 Tax=Geothrix fermentans TaxID=44676 RepID=UPI0003F8CD18|nr:DUF4388 domain-containing protein [Geothrix fermentans]
MAMAAKDVFGISRSHQPEALDPDPGGFEGAISHLALADVIQLEGQNQFSGSILVVYQEREGQVFFQQGEVVHAEVGTLSGEEAFNHIMGWPGGSFRLQPNVTSLRRSIQKRREHLLLSAHQWLDETRRGPAESEPAPPAPVQPADPLAAVERVPGVALGVFMDRNGAPRGHSGAQAEGLAARGAYLAGMVAAPLAEAFRLGELQVAATHGGPDRMLLFRSKETGLAVSLAAGAIHDDVENGIRQALSTRRTGR